MRIVVLASFLFVWGCGSTSYMTKGSWEGEGTLELSTTDRGDSDFESDVLDVQTFLGMAATDNLELGPVVGYRDEETGFGSGSDYDAEDFLLAWRGRWNFPSSERLAPFAEVDLGFGRREADTTTGTHDSTDMLYALGLGLRFIVGQNAAVVLKGQYLNVDWDREVGGDLDRWALLGGVSLKF
ncbi:MAG: outer membrane beta-barrel protein [Planctomycetota bacterium]